MTDREQGFIHMWLSSLVEGMRRNNPALVPGEIYDAIAKELERRCRAQIAVATELHQQEEEIDG